jgi:phosphopantothenoylcysteine decarboxylase/phosphopantothenate--cysteine ligase
VAIAAAAVADYKPKNVAQNKIKKTATEFTIELEKTKDILASLGEIKKNQFLIGFALETENEIENAKLKVQKKNLDLIVLNSLKDEGAGFGKPTNKITFIDSNFKVEPMELKSKEAVADDILNKVIAHFL